VQPGFQDVAAIVPEGTKLREVHLDGADLEGIDLIGAHLQEAHLMEAHLQGADLREANLGGTHILAEVLDYVQQWKKDFPVELPPGDLREAFFDHTTTLEYQSAIRANRQLAIVLQDQGLYEDAAYFAYRRTVHGQHL
jgi:uncharacterized protein YjbI with pentapeptide repeats